MSFHVNFAPFLGQGAFSINASMLVRLEVGKYHDAVITDHSLMFESSIAAPVTRFIEKWSEQRRRCLHGLGLIAV